MRKEKSKDKSRVKKRVKRVKWLEGEMEIKCIKKKL